jgi:2',3'-cyclic-nucleotide 2'-phosphodiesterase (5'-nucleotidase family)
LVSGADQDGDGRVSDWEKNRIVSILDKNGRALDDHKVYRVATYDFLLNGGDYLMNFMSKVSKNKISRKNSIYCREMVVQYLKRHSPVNTAANPLVDPKRPRVTVVRD